MRCEPVLLQTLAKPRPGPVEDHPEVGRGKTQFLTNLRAVQVHYLAHHEDAGRVRRKLFQAEIYHIEKLALCKRLLGIPPRCGWIFPVPDLVEQGVKVAELAFLFQGGNCRPPGLLSDSVDDLVLEYPCEPGLEARSSRK